MAHTQKCSDDIQKRNLVARGGTWNIEHIRNKEQQNTWEYVKAYTKLNQWKIQQSIPNKAKIDTRIP